MGVYWQDEDTTERIAKCIGCGCTDERACPGGCSWIAVDDESGNAICSNCPEFLEDPASNIELLTPRCVDSESRPSVEQAMTEAVCWFDTEDGQWLMYLRIQGEQYRLPVREGEPDGDTEEIGPGIKAWTDMRQYGLTRLGAGVWRLTPSLWVPGALHAFIVLCDVPEPAPFSRPMLFSAAGEIIR